MLNLSGIFSVRCWIDPIETHARSKLTTIEKRQPPSWIFSLAWGPWAQPMDLMEHIGAPNVMPT